VDAVEKLLGNVPQEILPEIESRFPEESTLAVEIVGTIALAYAVVGQPTRAIDLLHRMAAISAPKGRKDIDQLVRLYLGLLSADFGDLAPARQYGQGVLDYWLGEGDRPFFAWFASIMMAMLHRADNRPEMVREVLAIGHQARLRAHFPFFFGGGLLYVLEWLKQCGVAVVDGLTFELEIDRYLSWYNVRMRGLAHLMKARVLTASGRREGLRSTFRRRNPLETIRRLARYRSPFGGTRRVGREGWPYCTSERAATRGRGDKAVGSGPCARWHAPRDGRASTSLSGSRTGTAAPARPSARQLGRDCSPTLFSPRRRALRYCRGWRSTAFARRARRESRME